jgi:hypothetical protein
MFVAQTKPGDESSHEVYAANSCARHIELPSFVVIELKGLFGISLLRFGPLYFVSKTLKLKALSRKNRQSSCLTILRMLKIRESLSNRGGPSFKIKPIAGPENRLERRPRDFKSL